MQRVANRGRERRLSRMDALTAYAMDRLLYRLGRSAQAHEFYLKGGVLVANLLAMPHRFTRDIDLLRRHGSPDPNELRVRFREIVAIPSDDGVHFDPNDVRAVVATRDVDGYDGVRVSVRAMMGATKVDVHIDVGFGDAVQPPAERRTLASFLDGDLPARVFAYEAGPVLAEKIETLLAKFPIITHRLKDLLDVVVLASHDEYRGELLVPSLQATFVRRGTVVDIAVLDEMHSELCGRRWTTRWAAMRKEKAVAVSTNLPDALRSFDTFVRPLVVALTGGVVPGVWPPGGPWREISHEGDSDKT